MSIDKDLLERLMEGRSPGDLFGKTGILTELTKALAERALSTEIDSISMKSARRKRRRARTSPPIAATGAARRRLPPTAVRLSCIFLVTAMVP